ncbi:MAG: glycogen debranching enzyme, partial [Lentisphaerota bacterium]
RHICLHRILKEEDEILNERGFKNNFVWHGTNLNNPGFDNLESRALSFTIGGKGKEEDLHVMINMYWEKLNFEIPSLNGRKWHVAIDTFKDSPDDIHETGNENICSVSEFTVFPRSIVALVSK